MRIIFKGKEITKYVQSLDDEEMVAAHFEAIKDKEPVGDEDTANWKQRNNNLLAVMLAVLAEREHLDESLEDDEFIDLNEDGSIKEDELPLYDYDSLYEDEEVSEEATESDSEAPKTTEVKAESEYGKIDIFYY